MIVLQRFPKKSIRHPKYTREELREIARRLKVPRGRDTGDTLRNLKKAGYTPV